MDLQAVELLDSRNGQKGVRVWVVLALYSLVGVLVVVVVSNDQNMILVGGMVYDSEMWT